MKKLEEASELLVSMYPEHSVFVEASFRKYSHNKHTVLEYSCTILKDFEVVSQINSCGDLKLLVDNIIEKMSHAGDKGE